MLGRAELERLELRKRALILESELNRFAWQVEARNLRGATAWMSEAARMGVRVRSLVLLAAPVAGLLAARLLRPREASPSRFRSLLRSLPTWIALWKAFVKPVTPAEPQTPTDTGA